MRPTTSEQIREAFLDYFEEHRHQRVASSSLIPYNDDTLLLTNAGMVQFKDVFLGLESRPYQRATTSQKCMRVSGKHNDLENVGPSSRHHTFFEMLGNFSFGDYFKKEAIQFGYDFLTKALLISPDLLYYTVYVDDDEAFAYWTEDMGISPDRVYRMGDETNFWSMGDVGPCGPTSEIHYDWGSDACTCGEPECSVFLDNDCERWLEIWNLVFMQFNQDAEGVRTPLPKTGVDTGLGLERIVSVVQDKAINYETDLFVPVMDRIQALLGHSKDERAKHKVGYRVIADHARAAAFLVADGVRPGPAGAGYVLRMIIRRAYRFGRKIGFDAPFLAQVCEAVIEKMGDAYPELRDRRALIRKTVSLEEEQFITTLDRALGELDRALAELREFGKTELAGDVAFELKATHGLPFEVTRDICHERGFSVDEQGFLAAERSHKHVSKGKISDATFGLGAEQYAHVLDRLQQRGLVPEQGVIYDPYGLLTRSTQLLAILKQGAAVEQADEGEEVELVLAETSFYVESGGQISDTGLITAAGWRAQVTDVERPVSGLTIHHAQITEGVAQVGAAVDARIDEKRRWDIMRNHTATHLLHRALRTHLGEHVHQAGSLVAPDRLRFDFTHDAAVSQPQLLAIVNDVNEAVLNHYAVDISYKPQKQALAEGATALFGEKYGDIVRTVVLGERDRFFSYELCGGIHVSNTSQIGPFIIVSESSVAAGVRRIEALTGFGAEHYVQDRMATLDRVSGLLNAPIDSLEQRLTDMKEQLSALNREVSQLRQQALGRQAEQLAGRVQEVQGVKVLATRVEVNDSNGMRTMADDLRNKLGSGLVVLGAELKGRPTLIAAATPDVVKRGGHAGQLVKTLSAIIGGGGGGRSDMAQAGGRDATKLDEALAAAANAVEKQLG
ncbi:MAG: alanine--tRNA ligase [Chloroflexi bacterium]|nr:alanine--tRNA ligase [Chloroflexota bacterium]